MIRLLGRAALLALSVLAAITLEYSVLPFVHLPRGGPDLVLLAVLAFSSVWGRSAGAVSGFLAGLALDLAPPATAAVGRHAIVLALVGALAGHAAAEMKRSALRTSLLAGLYALAAVLADAVLGTLLGDGTGITRSGLALAALATAGYTAIATPLVVPGLAALGRRFETPGTDLLAPAGDARGPVHRPHGVRPVRRPATSLSVETPETV